MIELSKKPWSNFVPKTTAITDKIKRLHYIDKAYAEMKLQKMKDKDIADELGLTTGALAQHKRRRMGMIEGHMQRLREGGE